MPEVSDKEFTLIDILAFKIKVFKYVITEFLRYIRNFLIVHRPDYSGEHR